MTGREAVVGRFVYESNVVGISYLWIG
jgi:hypothetical protein